MKVVASVLQNLVLLTFARCGRTAQDGIEDESEIKSRSRDSPLRETNDDEVSQFLYTYEELRNVFDSEALWVESMRTMLLLWCEKMVDFCRNSSFKK